MRRIILQSLRAFGATPQFSLPGKSQPEQLQIGPIIISGFFSDSRGVAQVSKLAAAALSRAGFTVIEHDITCILRGETPSEFSAPIAGGVWILYCNPPEARVVMDRCPTLAKAPLFRIGAWAWELSEAPSRWIKDISAFHELWVLSEFQAEAFRMCAPTLRVMPPPIVVGRAKVSAETDVTCAHVSDLRSSVDRKNPAGAILAYLMAFPAKENVVLKMKISGVDEYPDEYEWLKRLAQGRSDIEFIGDYFSSDQMKSFIDQADVLIALHRAEGFGLPVAEAMAWGKAVVTTAWAGVLDFVPGNEEAQLVRARLVPIEDRSRLYSGSLWAEPDISDAAAKIKRLKDDARLRLRIGLENQASIAKLSSPWRPEALKYQSFAKYAVHTFK